MRIGILSSGAVTPGGIGVESLDSQWPQKLVVSGSGKHSYNASLVDQSLPEITRWGKEPRLRRASPIAYYMTEAASQALSAVPDIDLSRTGVIASFFLGCLVYSVRFYKQMTTEGRRFASPILFPETVFNSPVSHLVSTLGTSGPVYSQVGDKSCWANSLRTAECWMRKGNVDNVLLIGAEEFDPYQLDAFHSAGWMRGNGLVPGEGAGAILLTSKPSDQSVMLAGLCDGYCYSSKSEALAAGVECLAVHPRESKVMPTATGWLQQVESKVVGDRMISGISHPFYEASTASAVWDTIRAAKLINQGLTQELIVPYWGLSQQFGAARLTAPSFTS